MIAMSKVKRISKKINKKTGAFLVYLMLLPMFFSVMESLFEGDYVKFVLKLVGFILLSISAGALTIGIRNAIEYEDAVLAKAPKLPYKVIGSIILGIGVFYLGFIVGHKNIIISLFVGLIGTIGAIMYYGIDPLKDKLPDSTDVNPNILLKNLQQAQKTLKEIKDENLNIHDIKLHQMINEAVKKAQKILDNIANDPKDVRMARKFLVVYLDGVKNVASQYNKVEEDKIDQEMKERLYQLLKDVQEKFDKEMERLQENDKFDLDVQIDTLKEQIKN